MGLPAPAYQDETCALYQGDALQLMPELAPASVQLIIADVPYFRAKLDYLGKRLDWDRQWPTREAYLSWLRQMAHEWQRVLAPNGSLYCFAAPTMAAHVEVMLEDYFTIIQRITWQKPPFATKAEMFRKEDLHSFFPVTEAILFCEQRNAEAMALGESGYVTYDQALLQKLFGNPIAQARHARQLSRQDVSAMVCGSRSGACWNWEDGIRMPTKDHFTQLQQIFPECFTRTYEAMVDEYQTMCPSHEPLWADYEALRRPFTVTPSVPYTDVWSFQTVPAEPGKHAAEKPMALLRHMIEVSSRPGDLVLDPTCGSASTLDAARQCGRRSIGMELEAASIAMGQQRLAQQLLPWDELP